jgi:phosphatidylinositol alpha-1,6-mannosyltransferase
VALSHGHEVWWAKIPIFKQLLRKIIKDVDYLGYLGNFTKNEIIKVSNEPNKLIQIAPGIDTNHFMPRTASAKLIAKYRLEDRRIIICVARLVHRKGQDQLIQAMPKILESHPDAILLLVGVGPIKQMLENSARQLRITHKIVFAGRVSHDELPDYLAISEIFAMPVRSRFSGLEVEGLGIVYLEASACAKPVVVGNSGGAADAVIDGVTGLLVNSSKVDEISNAICKLLDDPIKGKQMGEAGRDWVLANWQMSNWSKKFNKLLLDN